MGDNIIGMVTDGGVGIIGDWHHLDATNAGLLVKKMKKLEEQIVDAAEEEDKQQHQAKKVEMKEKKEKEEDNNNSGWYECPLPKPPLPELRHTLDRYLEYASVLAQTYGLDLQNTAKCVQQFEPIGQRVQQRLRKLAESEENWINRFWLTEMYLRQRMPLPLNFNPAYIFPRQQFHSEQDQLNYAAWLVRGFLDFKQRVDKKQIVRETVPDRFAGPGCTVRMCMDQYERILNFYREPFSAEDILHDRRRMEENDGGMLGIKQKCNLPGKTMVDGEEPHGEGKGEFGLEQNAENKQQEMKEGDEKGKEDEEEEHILVLSECQTFVLFTRFNGVPLSAAQLAQQLANIRAMSRNRSAHTVVAVGGAGTGGRERAAQFWAEMGKEPANQRALAWVRTAVFVLCLDDNDDEKEKTTNDGEENNAILNGEGGRRKGNNAVPSTEKQKLLANMEQNGMQILNGNGPARNGLNRWFDATIQLIVARNGCCGLCIEHSVAEGIVYIIMAETVIRFANQQCWLAADNQKEMKNGEDAQQMLRMRIAVPEPRPLSWRISEVASTLLREQIAEFKQLSQDIQLRVLVFSEFGKNAIKQWQISPDGFVQLSMQLAHFKLHGYLVSTYESATMRRFRLGRVDNIRAATPEALEWVKAMVNDDKKEMDRKRALFAAAANKQALITRENVTGHGIDNHLCALEVLCREEVGGNGSALELFWEPMWAQMMRFPLSTSQVSTSPDFQPGCYLCYGPVVRDGYGCAYNIQAGSIIFAISAWKSDPRTSADGFREKLRESLLDMRQMLERKIDEHKGN